MPNDAATEFSREAVGVFETSDSLQAAIDELLSSGFNRAEISLLAGEDAVQEKLGHIYEAAAAAEDDPDAPRTAYVSPESIGDAEGGIIGILTYIPATLTAGAIVASGGTIAAAAAATAIAGGVGAMIGVLLAAGIGESHAKFLRDQMERGGLLLWVLTPTQEKEARVVEILGKHSAYDVHIHGVKRH
ncbi:MAG TPA: hypothetical protein DIW51_11840 [Rhodospirillaceae bacterium]|nr:hypothetical protein [Rhodospirillaceae bacterium]HCS70643.1 hypothetical protein [Rhodospirillaceae bacterium]|tara:strand:+ start:1254 stop:1817 length:564 start_codon:yes stop_codon:yes gene_type:complete